MVGTHFRREAEEPTMTKHQRFQNPFQTTDTLDEILLDVATLIELSPRDRRVADNRYRRLKVHLERPKSCLAPYLVDGGSMIYAQGSIATSTTIINGGDDDRFDVDAIVEFDVPKQWNDAHALDQLEDALQGFPGAIKIERCTRCVQIQFPFMHMDVTILDRSSRIPIDRAGEIFHSPDKGRAYRVPSNPWGFTNWFRSNVVPDQKQFMELLHRRRESISRSRLQFLDEEERKVVAKADQVDLPPMIPNAIDAQEAVALKLLKRYVNLRYEGLPVRQPPSIYLTKRAVDVGFQEQGLAAQLFALAVNTASTLRMHLANGTRPDELNPSYRPDRINDRWPAEGAHGQREMQACAEALEYLANRLNHMASASLSDIAKAVDELFGERIGQEQRKILAERYDRRNQATGILTQPRTGQVYAPAIVTSSPELRQAPRHNFHPFVLDLGDDQ